MLPNFLLIGAMKAGTTSLHQYLRHHPQVLMARVKEPHFFTRNWDRGWEWYSEQFATAGALAVEGQVRSPRACDSSAQPFGQEGGTVVAVGEASTSYTKYPEYQGVPERISRHIPNVRLVYLMRHPVERMRSHYLHDLAGGVERQALEKALLENPKYLNASRYALQIERFLDHFPREQLLFICSEDLYADRATTLRQVYEFIDVDPSFTPTNIERVFYQTAHKRGYRSFLPGLRRLPAVGFLSDLAPQPLKQLARRYVTERVDPDRGRIREDLRSRLEDLLHHDVERLRSYLGEEFDGWGLLGEA